MVTAKQDAPLAAEVSLRLYDASGAEIWRYSATTQADKGTFTLSPGPAGLEPGVYSGRLTVAAANHESFAINLQVVQDANRVLKVLGESKLNIHLRPLLHDLTLVLFLPMLLGLPLVLWHYRDRQRRATTWYPLYCAFLWVVPAAWIIYVTQSAGEGLIPLFSTSHHTPPGVALFALAGCFAYAAYSLLKRDPSFSTLSPEVRDKILMALGGRILAAPYVAIVAHSVLSWGFPAFREDMWAHFLAFFTGLWITVVMEALNELGRRLLAASNMEKLAQQAARANAPITPITPSPTTNKLPVRQPTQEEHAYRRAAEGAETAWLKLAGVVGVCTGPKMVAGKAQGEKAIVALVYEKRPMADDDINRVPLKFDGYQTDVVSLDQTIHMDACCRPFMHWVNWSKVHQDFKARPQPPMAPLSVSQVGQVLVIEDPGSTLINKFQFDSIAAYKLVRDRIGRIANRFDFVAFYIDQDSGLVGVGDYFVPVHNEIGGVNFYKDRLCGDGRIQHFSNRAAFFGDKCLKSCQVHTAHPNLYNALHELGHNWCAYVKLRGGDGRPQSDLLMGGDGQGPLHWGLAFDNGYSCMDHDKTCWIEHADGVFGKAPVTPENASFCNLDLYLMGLLTAEEAGPLRILHDLREETPGSNLYRARVETRSIEDVIAVHGPRSPNPVDSQKKFTQAFVLITADAGRQEGGVPFVSKLDAFRATLEQGFNKATKGLATLNTQIT